MKSKVYSYLLILVMLIAAIWLVNKNKEDKGEFDHSSKKADDRNKNSSNRGFNRKISYLEYTAHAKCRMQCRHITQAEVRDIMKNGKINYRKTDIKDRPCPTYALEGYTLQDNQHVRIVFAQCDQKTKVVTCIDLDKDLACNCK